MDIPSRLVWIKQPYTQPLSRVELGGHARTLEPAEGVATPVAKLLSLKQKINYTLYME